MAAELKAYARIPVGDVVDDTQIALAVESASRAIDDFTGRQFGLTGSAVPRIYTWTGECIDGRAALVIDDVQTTTGLVAAADTGGAVYGTALVYGTDFDLWPWNAAANGRPWKNLVVRSTASLPCTARGVQVTANFGWTAVPDTIKQATLFQANRFFARRSAAFGISGSPDMGGELRLLEKLDPDVKVALRSYRRIWGAR
jgi:hypothetical protein